MDNITLILLFSLGFTYMVCDPKSEDSALYIDLPANIIENIECAKST